MGEKEGRGEKKGKDEGRFCARAGFSADKRSVARPAFRWWIALTQVLRGGVLQNPGVVLGCCQKVLNFSYKSAG